ncbi:MAG: HAMP domain-containing sensor histidine kinase [Rhizobiaceae bacterium]
MIKRRLFLQIYFTIIASLVMVVVVSAIVFTAFDRGGFDERVFDITAHLTWKSLPPATASNEEQADALTALVGEFDMEVTLFDSNKQVIAASSIPLPPPRKNIKGDGWHRHRGIRGFGPVWVTRFPDGRLFAVDLRQRRGAHPIIGVIILLACVAVGIGLSAYPFVRKLTGRLERLQGGVEKLGAGDLSARVEVEGKDEVARLATSFNTATAKIERLVNSNRQLLANASHELRTPLARVRMGVELLKSKPDAQRQEALENDIAELDQLIDEILLMSRLDTNSTPQMNENIDVLALAAEEASRYEGCDLEGEVCEVKGNSKLLRRAIRNLLDNAHKHGEPPVSIRIRPGNFDVSIQISDSGEGIAEDQHEQVFEPFYRAPGRQNVEGYGLGLALVRQISETHGGKVRLIKNGLTKSTVEIVLPRLS